MKTTQVYHSNINDRYQITSEEQIATTLELIKTQLLLVFLPLKKFLIARKKKIKEDNHELVKIPQNSCTSCQCKDMFDRWGKIKENKW